jgi:hypothetical protein
MKKLFLLSALFIFACTTDSEGNPCIYEPTLETNAVTDITETSATLNGVISIVSENCEVPNNTEQGFVYSTEIQPTLDDTQVNVNGTNITTTIEGLEPNTTYYVRAFLTNNFGDFYGDEVSFTSSYETFFERYDGVMWDFEQEIEGFYDIVVFTNNPQGYIFYGDNIDGTGNVNNNQDFYCGFVEFHGGGGSYSIAGNGSTTILSTIIKEISSEFSFFEEMFPTIILNSGNTLKLQFRNYNDTIETLTVQANISGDEILITSTNPERLPEVAIKTENAQSPCE